MKLTIKRLALILALAVILINITPYGAAFAIPKTTFIIICKLLRRKGVHQGTTYRNVLAVADCS